MFNIKNIIVLFTITLVLSACGKKHYMDIGDITATQQPNCLDTATNAKDCD